MASIKDIAQGRSDLYRVSPHDIAVKEGWNSREKDFDEQDAEDMGLAQSICEVGVKQPLTAFMEDGKLYLEDGHRRLAASLYAIEHLGASDDMLVPVRMSDKDSDEAERLFGQIIRNSGKPLGPLEMAEVFKRLRKLDWNDATIAKKAGVSRVYVGNLIALSEMPKVVLNLVRSGSVSATLAIETMLAHKGDGKKVLEVLKAAVAAAKALGKTRATKKHVKAASGAGGGEESDSDKLPEPKEKKPSVKAELRTIITDAMVELDDDSVILTLSVERYERIKELIGLTEGGETSEEDII